MSNILIQLAIFIAIGIAWRYFKPSKISADSLQQAIMTLIHWVFLPIVIFFAISVLKFNTSLFKYTMYVVAASGVAMAAAWFWLARTNYESKTKGALFLASSFGSVIFIGLPLTSTMIGAWTSRLAIVYLLVANILILYTVGLFLVKVLATPSKLKTPLTMFTDNGMTLIKEPLIIAALLGLLVNLVELKLPGWIYGFNGLAGEALIPLLLLTVGLSLRWDSAWNNHIKNFIPIAAIKLILVPLVLLLMVKLFGSPGVKTTKSLIINGMMPASLLGFYLCDRFNLDSKTYAIAFSLTTILALIAVPIWMRFL